MSTITSALGAVGVVTAALLLAVEGSGVVLETLTVLVTCPVVAAAIVPVTVTLTVWPGSSASSAQERLVPATVHVQPAAAAGGAGVAVAPVRAAGRVSAMRGAKAVEGPLLVRVTVQLAVWPGTSGLGVGSDLATDRSALGAVGVVVVEVLLLASGSAVSEVTFAVLTRLPVWLGDSVPAMVMVTLAPAPSVAAAQLTALPVPTLHVQPGAGVVAVTPVTVAGTVSVRTALVATDGPLLVTVTAQLTAWPGTTGLGAAWDFTASRSEETVMGVVAVAVLLSGCGSGVEELNVAVLLSDPVAVGATRPLIVMRAGVSGGQSMLGMHVTVWPLTEQNPCGRSVVMVMSVMEFGTTSVNTTSRAAEGPLLTTSRCQVTVPPAVTAAVVGVLVIAMSALGVSVTVTAAVLLAGAGSVVDEATVVVLVRAPVEVGAMVPDSSTVADAPGARLAAEQFTFWPATVHVQPAGAVAVMPVTLAGTASVSVGEAAVDGPLLVTVARQVTA